MREDGRILAGKYRLVEPIGQGGMGRVFRAVNVGLDRQVAIKVLAEERAEDAEAKERFLREAKAAGRVHHDHACEVFDFGADGSTLYYVMPLLRGRSLASAIESDGQFGIDRAVGIAVQLLAGLAAAHSAGVIHRDLKPSNVFLTRVGEQQGFVKILDFGISKLTDPALENDELTRTGAVLGTPQYMAPEQARGAKGIDQRVDIYAVGVILYEMLTGRRPVKGECHNDILWHLWNAPVKPPRAHRPNLPRELEELILQAMSRDPDQRFATAREFGRALVGDRFEPSEFLAMNVSGEPMDAPITDGALEPQPVITERTERVSKISTRPRRWLLPGLAIVSILVLGTAAILTASALSSDPRESLGDVLPTSHLPLLGEAGRGAPQPVVDSPPRSQLPLSGEAGRGAPQPVADSPPRSHLPLSGEAGNELAGTIPDFGRVP